MPIEDTAQRDTVTPDSKQDASAEGAQERGSTPAPSKSPSSAPPAGSVRPSSKPSRPSASPSSAPPSASSIPPDADPPASDAPTDEATTEEAEPSELDTLRAERDKLNERVLRAAADLDNFRKRARREVEEARLRGKDDAVRELLPVFDNLERAVRAADTGASDAVVEGVKMVLKLFEDTAQRMGLNRVKAVGERFDPAIHEALQQRETDEAPPGTIIDEIAAGYLFGQRLLRAAMVIVAAAPKVEPREPANAEQADSEGGDSEAPQ